MGHTHMHWKDKIENYKAIALGKHLWGTQSRDKNSGYKLRSNH
jgi:hypothetical protein